MNRGRTLSFSIVVALAIGCCGCTLEDAREKTQVIIDGSSTVLPITKAVAEEFQKEQPDASVVVGVSGTGGGFKKFMKGEIDINDASRPIKQSEADQCQAANIEFVELKIAIDGLSVVVNKQNHWCTGLTVAELKSIWEPDSKIKKWSDLNPSWPDETILLYGPDADSGTFDYFTEVICGESGSCRVDYTRSADDNVLVNGVAGDKYSLGYFGYAYYSENRDRLIAVPIGESEDGEYVAPTDETIESGKYAPLSRPLFIYVNTASCQRDDVVSFLRFFLSARGQQLATDVGYVKLSGELAKEQRDRLEDALK